MNQATRFLAAHPLRFCFMQGVGLPLALSQLKGSFATLSLAGKWRLEFAGGEIIEGAEAAGEFVGA